MDSEIYKKLLNKKKILVTGGTGLIGSGLLNYLLELSVKNKLDLSLFSISKNKIKKIKKNSKIIFYNIDLAKESLDDLIKFDYIFHCAGYGQPKKFISNPINTIKINTEGTFKLIKKLKKNGKFIFMSTSEIYSGNRKKYPNENDIGLTNTNHPRSSYIESKRCGEAIVNCFNQNHFNYKSIRLSLVYGPGTELNDNRVINEFIISALKRKKIKMLDSGRDLRHYIFLSDAIEMILKITLLGKHKIYNVGGKEQVSIFNLAKKISKITNAQLIKPSTLNSKKLVGTPSKVGVSINRFENEFGKTKLKTINYGIKKTIDWYKLLLKNEK